MRKVVNRSSVIKFIIIIVAVLLILSVWPMKLWKKNVAEAMPQVTQETTQRINYRHESMLAFVANNTHLEKIGFNVEAGTRAEFVDVFLTDSHGKQLAKERVYFNAGTPGKYAAPMDIEVNPGEVYFIKWNSIRSLFLAEETWLPESGIIAMSYYDGELVSGKSVIIDLLYKEPLGKAKSLLIVGIIVLIAAVFLSLTELLFNKKIEDKIITVEKAVKRIGNPATGLFVIFSLIMIALGKVTPYRLDDAVAAVSVLMLGAIILYGINHNRDGMPEGITAEYIRSHFAEIIQSVAIAGALQACCEYVSGLYTINHRVAERKQMLWFALILIAMFSIKEIINIYNLVYIIIASVCGYFYYQNSLSLNPDMYEDEIFVLRATVVIAILFGLVLIRTIIGLIKKKIEKPNVIYLASILVYFALIIIFRNERWWTVVLSVSFVLFILNYGMWNRKETLIVNILRGVVIQFAYATIWCWLYRPYDTFGCSRYTHFFHTSTITATYLTMVMMVAAVLVFSKIKKHAAEEKDGQIKVELRYIWKELVFFGVVSSYMIFSIARTAIAAVSVSLLLIFLVMFVFTKGRFWKIVLETLAALVISVIVMLPITFEIQRTIPCLVSNPYTYEIDRYDEHVLRGRYLNSEKYMTVGRLIEMIADRLLGIDENSIDIYNAKEFTYNEETATAWEAFERGFCNWSTIDELTDDQLEHVIVEDEYLLAVYENRYNTGDINAGWEDDIHAETEANEDRRIEQEAAEEDVTNGRVDIYKSYIQQMNMTGHNTMGAILKDGSEAAHAHDVYLQVAFDHGIPTGIVFVLFGIITLIYSFMYYKKNENENPERILTMAILISFAVAGIVEWTYHFSHPMAFTLWLCLMPLLYFEKKRSKDE